MDCTLQRLRSVCAATAGHLLSLFTVLRQYLLPIFGPESGSTIATNVVFVVLFLGFVYQTCDLLRLSHFITDRRQTSHTHK